MSYRSPIYVETLRSCYIFSMVILYTFFLIFGYLWWWGFGVGVLYWVFGGLGSQLIGFGAYF